MPSAPILQIRFKRLRINIDIYVRGIQRLTCLNAMASRCAAEASSRASVTSCPNSVSWA